MKIWLGKLLFIGGIIMLVGAFISAGVYAQSITQWFTELGIFGTALLKTQISYLLYLGIIVNITGITILIKEYICIKKEGR